MTAGMIPRRTSVKPKTASGRDRDVRAGHEPRAATEREPVDAAHDGRRTGVDRLKHRVQVHRVLDVLLVREVYRRSLPFDVGPRAEGRPLSGQQHHPSVGDLRERLGKLRDQGGVECIATLGPRERHPEDVSVADDVQRAHRAEPMVSRVSAKRFTADLERAGTSSAMLPIPFDVEEEFGRVRPPVRVTIRGHTWRTTPAVYGGVAYIGLSKDVRAAAGVDVGDRVRVELELDTEPRTVALPEDLRIALEQGGLRAAFDARSFTHRREYVEWVEGAKRTDTRSRRVAETVRRVRDGGAPP